ncbi:MAG: hypothetical protein LBO68_02080, partial [Synergistaceae bacterium]|nr:hypothetical protein [Synergistaceae bacterium]
MGRSFMLCLLCCVFASCSEVLTPRGEAAAFAVRSVDFYPVGARFVFHVEPDGPDKNFDLTLPGSFSLESVRFLTQGDVSSVRVETQSRSEWTPPTLAPLKARIDAQDRELKLLKARENALNQTKNQILAPLPKDLGGKDLILYIEDAQGIRERVESELVDLNARIEKAEKELQILKAEYTRKVPENGEEFLRVSGTFATGKPLLLEALTYFAGWNVRYDMDLDSQTGDIDAVMHAHAWQKTGLDVTGEFLFHTRQPSYGIAPPEVRPLAVNLRSVSREQRTSPEPLGRMGFVTQAAVNTMAKEDALAPAPYLEATLANVAVKGRGSLKGD